MKIRNLWRALLLLGGTLFFQTGNTQVTSLDYQIRYNTTTCHWDCYIIINAGSAISTTHRAQSNAQFSVVVPAGSAISVAQNFNPIQNNQTYTGTTPLNWGPGSWRLSPAVEPQSDFWGFTPTLNPTSFFNNLFAGDTVKLFSLNITPTPNCASGVRIYRNGIDPPSSAPGMGGGDFSNGYTVGGTAQRYRANLPQVNPPAPVLSAITTCSSGVEVDLTATTSTCQSPMTYSWSGPNGYTGTMQDVSINPSTPANNGTYLVTVTDSKGCTSTTSIEAISKPNAGTDQLGCPSSQYTISGTNPNTGTWSAMGSNPSGATLSPGANGQADVQFDGTALGQYKFIYDIGACKDTVQISINQSIAGSDPATVNCYISGTASLGASGTGSWSLGAGSAGTASINNPVDPNSTVSNFSIDGIYYFVWTSNGCTDTVQLQVNNECSCAITDNNLFGVNPSSFCGSTGAINILGSNASPAGGVYSWIYSLNGGAYGAATGTNNQQNYTTVALGQGLHRFRRVYSLPSEPGCLDTSNVVLITVNAAPATPLNLTANPNPACLGQTIDLAVNNVNGVTYTWTASSANAGLAASVASTSTMNPISAGTYTISVTATANGCTSNAATINVQVFDTPPTPTPGTTSFTHPSQCQAADGTISFSGLTPNTTYTINYTRNGVNQSANVTSNGSGVATITGLNAAIYANFVIVSANGCPSGTYAGPIVLIDPSAPPAPSNLQASPNPTCQNVTINLSVTNNPGATYTWSTSSPGAGLGTSTTNTNTMLPTQSGFFNIMVTQTVAGCTSPSASLGVSVNAAPPNPTAGNVTSTNPTTCGGSNGTISMSGYLSNTSYTVQYSFNGNPVTANFTSAANGNIVITGLVAGTYTNFSVTNISGCTSAVYPGPVTLTNPNTPAAPSNLTATPNPVCLGNSVALSVTNTPGATYAWTASSANAGLSTSTTNTNSMLPIATGSYTISVTQTVAGCTSPASSVTVTVNPGTPNPGSVTGSNPTTCGGNNGIITLTGMGSFVTYTVNFQRNSVPQTASLTSDNSGNILIIGLTAGVYTNFVVTNSFNCSSNMVAGPVILSDPNAPAAPTGLTAVPNPVCEGVTVNLSVTNNPGATYNWTASSGNAGLVASSTNATTMTSNVAATYTINVTQTVGSCTSPAASIQVVVNAKPPTPVAGQFTSTNPTTCGGSDGTISISGLVPNATYTLNYSKNNTPQTAILTANGSGVLTLNNLTAGSYNNFQLTNSNNCQSGVSLHTVNLSDPGAPPVPQNLTAIPNPACLGATINLSVTNTPGSIYTWTASSPNAGLNSSTTNTNSMLPTLAGSYDISVIQTIAGCTSNAALTTVVVNSNPPGLSGTNVVGTNPTTCGGSDGIITISGLANNATYSLEYSAGSGPLTVSITSNGSGVAMLTGLVAGTYSNFRITNASGCSSNVNPGPVVLTDPAAPGAPTDLTADPNPSCLGETVYFNVTGEPGANFTWSASSALAGLGSSSTNTNWMMATAVGSYVISVTQLLGSCSSPPATITVVVNPIPPTPTAGNITSTNPTVCAGTDGTISIAGYIANQSYTVNYSKNNVATSASVVANGSGVLILTNLTAGVYSNFSITSAAGCSSGVYAGPVNLNDPNAPPAPANLTAVPNPACLGQTVNLSVTNTPGATYSWTISSVNGGLGNSTTNSNAMTPILAGTYTVQVSQTIAGCTSPNASLNVVVNDLPPTPSANSVSKTDPNCDFSDGSISLLGLVPNATYTVNFMFNGNPVSVNTTANASGIIIMNNLAGGQYTNFSLVNAAGCNSGVYAGPVVLVNPGLPSPPAGIRVSPSFICVRNNVVVNVDPVQGASFNWTTSSPLAGLLPSSSETANLVPTAPGLYNISVTQTINGCTSPPTATLFEVRGDCFNPDFDVTYVNVTVNGSVRTNDGVPGPTYTNIQSVSGNPSSCIPVLQTDGSYSFTCGVAGVYNFEVNSCTANCEIVPLVITVLAENSNNKPPVVNHDYARTKMNIPVEIEIQANDKCQNSLTCALNPPSVVTPPTRGTYNAVSRIYTPNSNFVGIDSFRYEVCQTPGSAPAACARAWVYIVVISTQAANVTNAMDDYGQTPWNTQLTKSAANGLLANDTDPESNNQSVQPFTNTVPGVGGITVAGDGSYSFIPESGFYGPYSWAYQVCDDNISTACDQATLHILVDPENVASIVGNFVWQDNNGNGIQDIGEPGISNVQVRLYNNSGVLVSTVTTGVNGQYQFDNVLAGTYFIKVMTPANHVYSPALVGDPLTDSDITGVLGSGTTNFFTVLPGEDRLDLDAGLYVCSRVSGFLWYDYYMNDIKDNFENGINGIFVSLWRNVNGTFVKYAETFTGQQPGTASEDGYFNFPCVPPGQYYLFADVPLIGMVRVRPNIGGNPNKDSDITNANGPMTTNTFTLAPGQHKSDLAGGFYQMAVAGNLVWIDENVNGVQDLGEPAVQGVVVEARNPETNAIKGTGITDEYGQYHIEYLERENVYLKFQLPSGYSNYTRTYAGIGDDAINSDVDGSFGSWTTRAVSMEPSTMNDRIDMGIVQGALPVSWVYVNVRGDQNQYHLISWETAQEVNVSHYEVERSLFNTDDFVSVGDRIQPLPGHNINKIYSALDRDNQKSGVYYYRIKQVDLDGKYAYSKTVSIRNNQNIDVQIYPSPAVQKTTASIQLPKEDEVSISIFDANGRFIRELMVASSLDKGSHNLELDLTGLTSGVYSIGITIGGEIMHKKLIILDK